MWIIIALVCSYRVYDSTPRLTASETMSRKVILSAVAAPGCQSWGGGKGGGRRSGERESPAGVPVESLGRSPPDAEAFCLNIYNILSVHGRKLNELDFTHRDGIKSVINKATTVYKPTAVCSQT